MCDLHMLRLHVKGTKQQQICGERTLKVPREHLTTVSLPSMRRYCRPGRGTACAHSSEVGAIVQQNLRWCQITGHPSR